MSTYLGILAQVFNKAIDCLKIQIVPVRHYGSLDIYPEKERPEIPRYINIGAGSFYHPYWHNMDIPSPYYKSIQKGHIHIDHDLAARQAFPFQSSSLKVVYASHVIEHLLDEPVQYCFSEVHRCLESGGFFRITCPDIDLEYDAYCRNDSSFFPWPTPWRTRSTSIEQKFLEHFATGLTLDHPEIAGHKFTDNEIRAVFLGLPKEEALKYFIDQIPKESEPPHPEHHVNWFNIRKINEMLKKAGFEDIYESRYGQSKCPMMRNTQLFDSTVPSVSLYIECKK